MLIVSCSLVAAIVALPTIRYSQFAPPVQRFRNREKVDCLRTFVRRLAPRVITFHPRHGLESENMRLVQRNDGNAPVCLTNFGAGKATLWNS